MYYSHPVLFHIGTRLESLFHKYEIHDEDYFSKKTKNYCAWKRFGKYDITMHHAC